MLMAGRRRLLLVTTCSDDSKPYIILVALIKGLQNHSIITLGSTRGLVYQGPSSIYSSSRMPLFSSSHRPLAAPTNIVSCTDIAGDRCVRLSCPPPRGPREPRSAAVAEKVLLPCFSVVRRNLCRQPAVSMQAENCK